LESAKHTRNKRLGLLGDDCSYDDDEKVTVEIDA